jgi:hypothetical protein
MNVSPAPPRPGCGFAGRPAVSGVGLDHQQALQLGVDIFGQLFDD